MRIESNHNNMPAFCAFYTSQNLSRRLKGAATEKKLAGAYGEVSRYIIKNDMDKMGNADLILDTDRFNGTKLIAVIAHKRHGVPIHPNNSLTVDASNESLEGLKKWLYDWNRAFYGSVAEQLKF